MNSTDHQPVKPPKPNSFKVTSPHLMIYKWRFSSALSIMHRIAGFALFCDVLCLILFFIPVVYGFYPAFLLENEVYQVFFALCILETLTMLSYRALNGIRFLYIDAFAATSPTAINVSAYIMLTAFIASFLAFAGIILAVLTV